MPISQDGTEVIVWSLVELEYTIQTEAQKKYLHSTAIWPALVIMAELSMLIGKFTGMLHLMAMELLKEVLQVLQFSTKTKEL